MKKKPFDISQRLGDSKENVDLNTYTAGLLDVVDFMICDMVGFLKEEGRYLGVVKSYINSIREAYDKINKDGVDEDTIDTYDKILYLLKNALLRTFRRLNKKGLSKADCIICMVHKILGILKETPDFTYYRELRTIDKIITKLFDNIRHRAKNDAMFFLADLIRECMKNKYLGKFAQGKIDFSEEVERDKELILTEGITLYHYGAENLLG